MPSATQAIRPGGSPDIMRALEAEVVEAVWAATEPLLPTPPVHPLGCHRPRVSDRLCLWALLIRLTTGASWVDVEAILDHQVSDTTLRSRRDEWIHAGVFEQLKAEALAAFDRIVGLDLAGVALHGSLHKAAYGAREPARQSNGSGRARLEVVGRLRASRRTGGLGGRRRQPQRRRHARAGQTRPDQPVPLPPPSLRWPARCTRSARVPAQRGPAGHGTHPARRCVGGRSAGPLT